MNKPATDTKALRLLLIILLFTALFLFDTDFFVPDSAGYLSYARSILFDRNVHFANEFSRWGVQPFWNHPTETGYTENQWAIGPAILWFPFYLAGLAFTFLHNLIFHKPLPFDGYNRIFILLSHIGTYFYGLLTVVLTYKTARRFLASKHVTYALLLAVPGTPCLYYLFAAGLYAHIPAAFAIALFIYYLTHSAARPSPAGWATLGILGGLVAATRWQEAPLLLLPLIIVHSGKKGKRRGSVPLSSILYPAAALLVLSPQLAVWYKLYGSPVTVPQGSGSLEWLRPEIIHLVFSPHHGLFTWTPLFVFICAGAVPFCRRRPRYGIAFAVILFLQLYINSIFNWWGGWAFGVRRITDLFPIAVIFLGSFIGYVSQRRSRPVRSVVWLFLALCAAWTVLLFLNMKFAISGEEYLNLGGLISLQFRGITHIGMLLREAAVSSPWLSPEGWCALPLLLLTTLLALYLAGSIQRDDTARSLVRGFVFYCGGIAVLFAAVALRPLHAEALLPENEAGTLRNMTRLKKEPESLTTLGEIAKSAYALGLYHQSIRYQDRILERQPDNAQALFGKGIAMLYLDKDREAAAVFDTLRALTPDDPRALHYRGVCAAKRHDHEKALTFHKNAVKADPAYGAAYEAIGRCYEKMGLRYAARFAYQRAYNLSSMPLEKPEDKRDDDADQQAGGEGKIKPDVPPFDEDIAGETPQPGNGAPQP